MIPKPDVSSETNPHSQSRLLRNRAHGSDTVDGCPAWNPPTPTSRSLVVSRDDPSTSPFLSILPHLTQGRQQPKWRTARAERRRLRRLQIPQKVANTYYSLVFCIRYASGQEVITGILSPKALNDPPLIRTHPPRPFVAGAVSPRTLGCCDRPSAISEERTGHSAPPVCPGQSRRHTPALLTIRVAGNIDHGCGWAAGGRPALCAVSLPAALRHPCPHPARWVCCSLPSSRVQDPKTVDGRSEHKGHKGAGDPDCRVRPVLPSLGPSLFSCRGPSATLSDSGFSCVS